MAVLAALLFALIAYEVSSKGALTHLDQQLADWFNQHAFAPDRTGARLYAPAWHHRRAGHGRTAAGTWSARGWAWVADLLLVLPGGMLCNFTLKHIFARLRPSFDDPILVLHSYSFPSGHTIGATLLYAMLAAYLLNQPGVTAAIGTRLKTGERGVQAAVIGAALLLVALTAFSRVYLGAHFLSDVVGAMLLGTAWFALWTTVVFTWQRHYYAQPRSTGSETIFPLPADDRTRHDPGIARQPWPPRRGTPP
jgi:undecaprenyl-diphosphatase